MPALANELLISKSCFSNASAREQLGVFSEGLGGAYKEAHSSKQGK